MGNTSYLAVTFVCCFAACDVGDGDDGPTATAALAPRTAGTPSQVSGTATFTKVTEGVKLVLSVTDAGAGGTAKTRGVHLHVMGVCEGDYMSAMGHWNPSMAMHGLPTSASHHLGDCGNVEVNGSGSGSLTCIGPWTIGDGGTTDVVGKAIIVHAAPDDGTTQMPPGNAGARDACGVIAPN